MNSYLLLLLVMILWGMYPIFTHYFVLQLDPVFLVSIATLFSSIPFILKLILTKNKKGIYSRKILKPLLPIAIFAALGNILLFVGTKLTSGTNTGLLLQIEPIYALILGLIIFRESFDRKKFLATGLMILGAIVVIYKGFVLPNIGDIFILLTTLMYQISHTFVKKLLDKGEAMTLILAGRQLLGGLMLLFFAYIQAPNFLDLLNNPQNIGSGIYLGLYLSIVLILWYSAVKKMPLSVASSFLPVTALVALLGSAIFLKETITTQHYLGFIIIVSGMILQSRLTISKKV